MSSIGVLGQRIFYGVAAAVTAIAFAMPAIATAAQVTQRSVTLSSASAEATNVSYQVAFTPSESGAGAFVIDFCSDSPLVGQTCTTPTGFSAAGATDGGSATGTTVSSVTGAAGQVIVEGALTAATPVVVNIDGINNPTSAGALYARIVTYDTLVNAQAYTSTDLGEGNIDDGGVAISITPTIAVSGTVLEVLTFCVSGEEITATCGSTTDPVVNLGNQVGTTGIYALEPGTLFTGDIHTQITTNASSGATIRLKSSAEGCGGLLRAGDADACDIAPALDEGINATTDAKFGVITSAASATPSVTNASGTLVPVVGSFYNNTDYAMNYVANEETGVTSTFGDPFIDTAGAPANNQNMVLTFGAVANNNTPAGTYSADISLIAVGKF